MWVRLATANSSVSIGRRKSALAVPSGGVVMVADRFPLRSLRQNAWELAFLTEPPCRPWNQR